jgi:regulator of replication initiation timing
MLGIKKIWLYLAMGAAAVIVVTVAYYSWKSSVEQLALLRFNQQQLEQTVRNQEEFRQRQAEIEEQQRQAASRLIEENTRLRSSVRDIRTMLNNPEFTANDRPASDVLKRTIEQLRNAR